MNQKGFTLIDLLFVIVILGIIAMIAQPQFSSLISESKLNGAANELLSALEYAKNLAVTHQKPFDVKVFVASAKNQFTVRDVRYANNPDLHLNDVPPVYSYGRVFNPIDKKPYIIDFDGLEPELAGVIQTKWEYEGVRIVSVPGGGASAEIRFYPDGHSSETSSAITLKLDDQQRTISVDGTTGRITVN
jgi:type II secretion system protein H